MWVNIMINEQVIADDYPTDGVDWCLWCGMPRSCGVYLLWLSMKIFPLSRLRTELMIHLS